MALVRILVDGYSLLHNWPQLAQGQPLAQIVSGMKMVAEGVSTTQAARALAARHQVEMPLLEQVYQVLFEGKAPRQAIGDLLLREAKREFYGIV